MDSEADAYAAFEEAYKVWTDQMFADLDKDGDGQVSLDEFLNFYSEARTEAITKMSDLSATARLCASWPTRTATTDSATSHQERTGPFDGRVHR